MWLVGEWKKRFRALTSLQTHRKIPNSLSFRYQSDSSQKLRVQSKKKFWELQFHKISVMSAVAK